MPRKSKIKEELERLENELDEEISYQQERQQLRNLLTEYRPTATLLSDEYDNFNN